MKAAADFSSKIKKLSDELNGEFSAELSRRMGIHTGQSIVGMMGDAEAISRTAIGDNVNVASRLEQMTKTYNSKLVISKLVADNNRRDIHGLTIKPVEMRGRSKPLDIVSGSKALHLQFNSIKCQLTLYNSFFCLLKR